MGFRSCPEPAPSRSAPRTAWRNGAAPARAWPPPVPTLPDPSAGGGPSQPSPRPDGKQSRPTRDGLPVAIPPHGEGHVQLAPASHEHDWPRSAPGCHSTANVGLNGGPGNAPPRHERRRSAIRPVLPDQPRVRPASQEAEPRCRQGESRSVPGFAPVRTVRGARRS